MNKFHKMNRDLFYLNLNNLHLLYSGILKVYLIPIIPLGKIINLRIQKFIIRFLISYVARVIRVLIVFKCTYSIMGIKGIKGIKRNWMVLTGTGWYLLELDGTYLNWMVLT